MGVTTRTRNFTAGTPGGAPCDGDIIDTELCNTDPCPGEFCIYLGFKFEKRGYFDMIRVIFDTDLCNTDPYPGKFRIPFVS